MGLEFLPLPQFISGVLEAAAGICGIGGFSETGEDELDGLKTKLKDLPMSVMEKVAEACSPESRCVLAQTDRELRDAVENMRMFSGGSEEQPNVRLEDFCSSVSLLKLARRQGCPWDARTCACIAAGGNLEVLKWARKHKCRWDESTYRAAAQHGHLDILKWCRLQGCPWDDQICLVAARGGHLKLVQWARDNGPVPTPMSDFLICKISDAHGHHDILRYALSLPSAGSRAYKKRRHHNS